MSNRDRIARKAMEAEIARKEREAQQQAEPASTSKRKPKAKAAPAPIRIVWAVCDSSGAQVTTFPYAQEEAAQEDARQRTAATGRSHFVTKAKVPLE
jgi:hypothetical protein